MTQLRNFLAFLFFLTRNTIPTINMMYNAINGHLKKAKVTANNMKKNLEKINQPPLYRQNSQRSDVIEINEWLEIEIRMLIALLLRHPKEGIRKRIERVMEQQQNKLKPTQI